MILGRIKRWLRNFWWGVLVTLVGAGGYYYAQDEPISEPVGETQVVEVVQVIDGDTLVVRFENGEQGSVRLLGIDTPETAYSTRSEGVAECFAAESTVALRAAVAGEVVLEVDVSQGTHDKYGRLLAYVWEDGVNVNQFLVSAGYAHEYTYQNNPHAYQSAFKAAEAAASAAERGLWAAAACKE